MTTNQIRYQEHLEQKRHNVASETETSRANRVKEEIQKDYNTWFSGETTRHNLAQEALAHQTLVVNDAHYQRQDAEQKRHALATEQLQLSQQLEQQRHNLETERENYRHNTVSESQTWQDLAIDKMEALSREKQAEASMISAKASAQKAATEKQLADHKQQLERAEYVRNQQWHDEQIAIEQTKASAVSKQAEAALTQASAAQWNSITQAQAQANQVPQIKSQTSLNNARTTQTKVETALGIFDAVKDTVADVAEATSKLLAYRKARKTK